jgi:hypothetical protein
MMRELTERIPTVHDADQVLERNKILQSLKRRCDLLLDAAHFQIQERIELLDHITLSVGDMINSRKSKLMRKFDKVTDTVNSIKMKAERVMAQSLEDE